MRYAWLLVVAACDGGSGGIVVHSEPAALVLAQDGDGPWQPVALDADGNGRFESSAGFYGVARSCPAIGNGLQLGPKIRFDTRPGPIEVPCPFLATGVQLTGTTAPNTEVFVEQDQAFVDETGAYQATVRPGRHDVIAISRDAPERMLVERDVEILEDRTLDLPVATAGVPLIPITPTVTNGGPDVSLFSDINTRGDTWVIVDSDPTTINVPPGEVLVVGDRATVSAFGRGCVVQQQLGNTIPTFTLPVPMTARIDRASAQWFADPSVDWEFASLFVTQGAERMTVDVPMAWLAARGDTTALPGIDPAADFPGWSPDLGGNFVAGMTTSAHLGLVRGQFDGELVACNADVDFSW